MTRRRWTAREIQILGERYPEEGPNEIARELGRSADSVSSFAHRCGLRTHRWLENRVVPQSSTEIRNSRSNQEGSNSL